jgi:hypothetical protein
MGETILIGLFVNALWSFGEKVLYEIPKFIKDKQQTKFIEDAYKTIEDDLKTINDRFSNEFLEQIGEKFRNNYRGDINELILNLSENQSEITKILYDRFNGIEKN